MDYPKSLPDVYLHDDKFTDGTPDGAIPPSRDPAKTQNDIIDSILAVQEWTGEAHDEDDVTQMARGIVAKIADMIAAAIAAINIPSLVGYAQLVVAQTFTKAQRGAVVGLDDGATITPDFAAGNHFAVTLGGNRTLANPSNLVAGQSGIIVLTEDATGGRTLAFGSCWKFKGGTVPNLTTTANAVNVLAYYVESAERITANLIADTK